MDQTTRILLVQTHPCMNAEMLVYFLDTETATAHNHCHNLIFVSNNKMQSD